MKQKTKFVNFLFWPDNFVSHLVKMRNNLVYSNSKYESYFFKKAFFFPHYF